MNSETKKCPQCKEEVLKDALVCKHCGAKLDLGSKMVETGKIITGCGCALTLLALLGTLLLGLLL